MILNQNQKHIERYFSTLGVLQMSTWIKAKRLFTIIGKKIWCVLFVGSSQRSMKRNMIRNCRLPIFIKLFFFFQFWKNIMEINAYNNILQLWTHTETRGLYRPASRLIFPSASIEGEMLRWLNLTSNRCFIEQLWRAGKRLSAIYIKDTLTNACASHGTLPMFKWAGCKIRLSVKWLIRK